MSLANPKGLRVLRVAVCGAGVVGGGVLRLLARQRALFRAQSFDFDVALVVAKGGAVDAALLAGHPAARVSGDAGDALAPGAGLDIVVELMGGATGAARDVVLGAAARGMHVVTANKALLSHALPEVVRAFTGARRPRLGYEASVCGTVPVIRALRDSLLPDNVRAVKGILNGTTNFILTAMAAPGGGSFAGELARAQAAGFAEADATADVEGHDARNKLVLLTRLAFGVTVAPDSVPTEGIAGVSALDFACARELGHTIKLLGSAAVHEDPRGAARRAAKRAAVADADASSAASDTAAAAAEAPPRPRLVLELGVTPTLVRVDSALGSTDGALNTVCVDGEFSGRTVYGGAGAGSLPTALSVVADMVSIAQRTCGSSPFPRMPPSERRGGSTVRVALHDAVGSGRPQRWYVRGPARAVQALRARAGAVVERAGLGGGGTGAAEASLVLAGLSRAALDKLLARSAAAAAASSGVTVAPGRTFTVFPIDED